MGDFVGCAEIVRKQAETLSIFRAATASHQWMRIHDAHYDWWMFPIDVPSSFGDAYAVGPAEVAELKATPGYLPDYLDGARILVRSWGWDLDTRRFIEEIDPDQVWQKWPIRLEKCGRSLWLFDEHEAYHSVRDYALALMADGVSMSYRDRDCGDFFRQHS
ncbi:MAG: hypothetical protein FJW80_00990 [Actinobacteria bacterium]|nr:hypothetical protein [Actinomycetota bacterium]